MISSGIIPQLHFHFSTLRHKNLVLFQGICFNEGSLYILTEYCSKVFGTACVFLLPLMWFLNDLLPSHAANNMDMCRRFHYILDSYNSPHIQGCIRVKDNSVQFNFIRILQTSTRIYTTQEKINSNKQQRIDNRQRN